MAQYAVIRLTEYGCPDELFVCETIAEAHNIAATDAEAIGRPLSLITAYPGGDQGDNTPEMAGAYWIMPISRVYIEQAAHGKLRGEF